MLEISLSDEDINNLNTSMENILLRESKENFEERKSVVFNESFNQIFNQGYKT